MNKKRIIFVIIFFVLCYVSIKLLGVDEFISLENLKTHEKDLQIWVHQNYFLAVLIYILLYILVSSTPFPGDSILMITAGYLFGFWLGVIYTILSVTIGGIIAFLIFRYFIRHNIHYKPSKTILALSNEIGQHSGTYFLMLRILPFLPTSVVNFIAALSPISLKTFVWTTILGIKPITFVYTYAGVRLHEINSLNEIFTLPIILFFIFLFLTIVSIKIMKKIKKN